MHKSQQEQTGIDHYEMHRKWKPVGNAKGGCLYNCDWMLLSWYPYLCPVGWSLLHCLGHWCENFEIYWKPQGIDGWIYNPNTARKLRYRYK